MVESLGLDACRACLSREDQMIDLLKHNDAIHNIKLCDEYFVLTNIQVNDDDVNLPSLICMECLKKLLNAFNFRVKCLSSEECLQNQLVSSKDSKEKNDEINEIIESQSDFPDITDTSNVKENVKLQNFETFKVNGSFVHDNKIPDPLDIQFAEVPSTKFNMVCTMYNTMYIIFISETYFVLPRPRAHL